MEFEESCFDLDYEGVIRGVLSGCSFVLRLLVRVGVVAGIGELVFEVFEYEFVGGLRAIYFGVSSWWFAWVLLLVVELNCPVRDVQCCCLWCLRVACS